MKQANELRIGNWVSFEKEPFIVTGINQIFNDEPYEVQLKDSGGMFQDVGIEDISPIPITSDWLIKLGFKDEGKEMCLSVLQYKIQYSGWSPDILVSCKEDNLVIKVKHIHHLQNIIFALTNSELTTTP